MYTPHPFTTSNNYSSLNNSIVQPAPYHTRTYSNTKISPPPPYHLQRIKTPSHKKLTLTCQTSQSSFKMLPQKLNFDGEKLLKKRGDYFIPKARFDSLQISQVRQNITNNQQEEIQQIKKIFQDKFRQLQYSYAQNVRSFNNQLKLLQIKLANNARQIDNKNKQIEQLESQIKSLHLSLHQTHKSNSNCLLQTKISDLQTRLQIVTSHLEQQQNNQLETISSLQNRTITYFGSKLLNIKSNCQTFLCQGFKILNQVEQKVNKKQAFEKMSEGTRESTQSLSSENNKSETLNRSTDQCGLSFWDDCFFYPQQHSDDCNLVIEMAKRREQPLCCWIDQQGFMRYSDSNSYIFNRKGDKIRLSKQQIQQLVSMKLLIVC